MKRILICAGMAIALALPVSLNAQVVQNPPKSPSTYNHVELGVYGDLFRVSPANAATVNLLGLGGRLGINVQPHMALEAELNYDFEQNYTSVATSGGNTGGTSTTITSGIRPITGLFGPKFQLGSSGPVRLFATGKVGFIEWSSSSRAASGSSFTTGLNQFGSGNTYFAAYPGGGIEFFGGPIGVRIEAGDEIWVNNGAYNNLRVTFGPTFRF